MRPKGHIRDDLRPPRLTPHAHLVGAVQVPSSAMLPARIDDQQGSSCTGSYGLLVETWCAARGIACDPISRFFGYALGRQIANPLSSLKDEGANPSAVIEGMRRIGVLPESSYPSTDLARINERVDLYELEIAAAFVVKDVAAIDADGPARCSALRQSIAAGFPVGFAIEADDSFEGWSSDTVYTGMTGPSRGGHALRLVGYRPGAFRVANSWGTGWGDGGFCWMSDAFVGGSVPYDFYALDFATAVHG